MEFDKCSSGSLGNSCTPPPSTLGQNPSLLLGVWSKELFYVNPNKAHHLIDLSGKRNMHYVLLITVQLMNNTVALKSKYTLELFSI